MLFTQFTGVGFCIYKMLKPKVFRKKKISFLKPSRIQYFDGQPAAQIITSQYHQIGYVVQNRKSRISTMNFCITYTIYLGMGQATFFWAWVCLTVLTVGQFWQPNLGDNF